MKEEKIKFVISEIVNFMNIKLNDAGISYDEDFHEALIRKIEDIKDECYLLYLGKLN